MKEIDGDKLDERKVLLTTLITAGVKSLGGFMIMFAFSLVTYPEALEAVVKNPDLLADAIEETLRSSTSAQRFRRRLMKDVELHGQAISSVSPGSRSTALRPISSPGCRPRPSAALWCWSLRSTN